MGMEVALPVPYTPPRRRLPWVLLTVVLAGIVLLGVALGIRAMSGTEVPLKPCNSCPSCVCPTGLNGPRCGCPQ